MISDARLSFGAAIDLSQTAATYNTAITDQVDTAPLATGNVGRNLAAALDFGLYFKMTEALVGATATLRVQLFSGATSGAMTNQHIDTGVQAVTTWTIGRTFFIPLPYDSSTPYLRWLGMQFIIATATTTAGIASACLVPCADMPRLFVNNITF